MSRNANAGRPAARLAKGQLWQARHLYVYIVDLGKRLIHFKLMDHPKDTWARTQISAVETLWRYLHSRHAKLVKRAAA